MNCSNCHRQYNQTINVPRLLILCGHSLCQACCLKQHNNSKVQCPQCHSNTYVDSINLLPKNLALLNMPNIDIMNNCPKHNKKYEAFCQKQKLLICVDCILQDGHKNHPMQSIKNAYNKQNDKLSKTLIKLSTIQQNLSDKLNINKQNYKQSKQHYNNTITSIKTILKDIRQIIDIQQQNLLNKCKQTYNLLEKKIIQKNGRFGNYLDNIHQCIQNLKSMELQTQIIFLQNTQNRQIIIDNLSIQIQQPIKILSLNYNKNNIIDNIIKNLQKSTKQINSNSNSTNQSQNNQNQNKKYIQPIYNNPSKINKKISNTQKHQPFKKISKKQPQPTQLLSQNYQVSHQRNYSQNTNNILQKYDINTKCQISSVDPKQSLFNSFMSSMTTFLVQKKSIYIIGGFGQDVNNIIKMNIHNFSWQQVSIMNSNRSKFGSVALDKGILIFGGKKGKQRVSDGQIWNGKWITGYNMSKAKSGFGVINIGQLVYFIGGNDGQDILNNVETLNLQTGQWKKKQSMNQPRDQLSVALGNDGKIYAIGGFGGNDNQPLKTVQIYDPVTDKWSYAPSMKYARRALACAVLADGIYAIGGFDGNVYMSSVEKYQEGTDSWVQISSMKQPRCTHSAVPIFESQEIFVFGGFDYIALDSVQKFSIITGQWQQVCRMPTPRFMHSSILYHD